MSPYCPRCRTLMKYQHTHVVEGRSHEVLYACEPCRVRCQIVTTFYFDADSPVPQTLTQEGQ
jgi:hypothetical protein